MKQGILFTDEPMPMPKSRANLCVNDNERPLTTVYTQGLRHLPEPTKDDLIAALERARQLRPFASHLQRFYLVEASADEGRGARPL